MFSPHAKQANEKFLKTEAKSYDAALYCVFLLSGQHNKPALFALLAFLKRLDEIQEKTKEPGLDAIRLTWWRESVKAFYKDGTIPPEPILQTLLPACAEQGIKQELLHAMIEHSVFSQDISHDMHHFMGGMLDIAARLQGFEAQPVLAASRQLGPLYGTFKYTRELNSDESTTILTNTKALLAKMNTPEQKFIKRILLIIEQQLQAPDSSWRLSIRNGFGLLWS